MKETKPSQAVLFLDVAGSSALTKRVGDVAAERTIRGLLDRLIDIVTMNSDRAIKSNGDTYFEAPHAADHAATSEVIALTIGEIHKD